MTGALLAVDCGLVVYEDALRWQHQLAEARRADLIDDVVLLLEHDPVYTAGRRADVAANVLGITDIRVVRIDRGGDVTYHGPGQAIAYPVIRLPHAKAVRPYVAALEEACVRTAAAYGVEAKPDADRPGVWVGNDKLAAVGVRVDGKVTTHGLAFNVNPDLSHFAGLIPCGLAGSGTCSLASLGVEASVAEVAGRLAFHLGETLGRTIAPATPADVGLTGEARPPTETNGD